MVYIKLPFPIIDKTELKDISKKLKEPYEKLDMVQNYALKVAISDGKVLYLTEQELYDKKVSGELPEDGKTFDGSPAICEIAKVKGVDIHSIQVVYVPIVVLHFSKSGALKDIIHLLARIKNRENRYNRLLEYKAPEIIRRNEARMLEEAVFALSYNERLGEFGKSPFTRDNVRIRHSLSSIGYSLFTGEWEQYNEEDEPEIFDPPNLFTTKDLSNATEAVLEEKDTLQKEYDELEDKYSVLEKDFSWAKGELNSWKEKYSNLQKERDKTVRALSKENLALSHRIDEIIANLKRKEDQTD